MLKNKLKSELKMISRVFVLLTCSFAITIAIAEESVESAGEEPSSMETKSTEKEGGDAPNIEEFDRLREAIKVELREELLTEVREELEEKLESDLDDERDRLRAEVQQAIISGLAAREPETERWSVQAPSRPSFFELDGYLRLRGDVFVNLDMNAGVDVHGRPLFVSPAHPDSDTLTSVNQRLRLDPILNISDELRVRSTIDVLDNIVWGQNPDLFPRNSGYLGNPLLLFSDSQAAPVSGVNAARDSLAVKRAWAEVHTPVGWLHFGRMGSHWGTGMLVNDGDDLDSDHGTTVDRLMFIAPLGDHFMVPAAVDVVSSGPVFADMHTYQGQPFDLENRDNALQYLLAIARKDSEEEVRRQVLDGRMVFNYGFYNLLRRQVLDYVGPVQTDPRIFDDTLRFDRSLEPTDFVRRDAIIYTPDIWFRFNMENLRLEFEAAAVFGRIGNGLIRENGDPAEDNSVSMMQFGAVAQGEYSMMSERLRFGAEAGFASGDKAPGMGVDSAPGGRLDYPQEGAIDGRQYNLDQGMGELDRSINNFKFHTAYYIDEILWRRVLGQVTDAVYVKPAVSYDLAPAFGFDLAAIYSRAVYAESTPGDSAHLGIEVNAGLRYASRDGFVIRGVYGILFPLNGLQLEEDRSPEIAQVIRGVAAITF